MDDFEVLSARLSGIRQAKAAMTPYQAGYDCGKNGANTKNCHFTLFSSPDKMAEWERGKRAAEASP